MGIYDVVVVGAGLAGLHFARRTAGAGHRTLLIDRKCDVGSDIRTTGIFVRKTLDDFPIHERYLGPWVRRVALHAPSGRTLELEAPSGEFRVVRMSPLHREILREAIVAGVDWQDRTHFISSEAGTEGSIVRLRRHGRDYQVQAQLLVGADGAVSRVARALELDENREWIVGLEDVYEWAGAVPIPVLHSFVDPVLAPGYIAWIVADGVELHVGVGGYAREFDPGAALRTFHALAALFIGNNRGRHVERRGGRIPVGGILRRIGSDRGLLIGDAAGAPSPLTAGGLDACYRLSEYAAEVASAALKGDRRALAAAYSGDRFKARLISRGWMRRMMASVRSPLVIEAAFAALSTPLLRGLAWQIFFGRGSFPDQATTLRASPMRKDSRRRSAICAR